MVNRRLVRLGALLGVLFGLFLLAPAAWATVPPSPTVTAPAASDVTIHLSEQPIHFVGTVAGPVSNFDQIHVDRYDPPNDPPELCNFVLVGVTDWSCDSAVTYPVGDYELRVVWLANDPSFAFPDGPLSPPTVITLHVIADVQVPTPAPTHTTPAPVVVPPIVTPTPTPTPTPTRTPTPTPTPEPTPDPTPAPAAVVAAAPVAPDDTWKPTDHPKTVLGIGVAAFAITTLIGPAGLALSSVTGAAVSAGALAAAAGAGSGGGKGGGSIKGASTKSHKFDAAAGGPGDQSRTWRTPGWRTADAWSLAVPVWLATRSPLTARVLADGGYLRAIFSTAWLLGPLVGFGLGLASVHQTGGVPIAPSVLLTGLLLVLAIFDAAAGGAGVLGFLVGMAIWRSDKLSATVEFKSFLGLAALWFAIPLISAAARPFRRAVSPNAGYAWDRLADGVIATLIAGWAVQKTIGGMPGLSGLDLSIAHHANKLALIAMAAVVARILVEELGAWRYPNRLLTVQGAGKLPQPGPTQRLFATGLRTGMFVFMASAFLGNCWQLWVGAVLFAIPQILSIYERKFPNSARLHGLMPVGVLKTLVMLIIGTYFARLVFSMLHSPESMLRNGFLLLSLPGLALSLVGLFGHDGPDPKWTWSRQAVGTLILGATVALVLTGW